MVGSTIWAPQGEPGPAGPPGPEGPPGPQGPTGGPGPDAAAFVQFTQDLANTTDPAKGAALVGRVGERVDVALNRAGEANEYAWGNIKQNTADFASFGPNLAPALTGFTKTAFDASGNHTAGTSGSLVASVAVAAFSMYRLVVTIVTTVPGSVQFKMGTQSVFPDTPAGYYFSNAPILADGVEQDRTLSSTVYTFMAETSSDAWTSLSAVTDATWGGAITAIEFYKVNPTKFVVGGAGTGNGPKNPAGIKIVGYNRNDIVLGDKFALGMFYDDGQPLMGAHNTAIGSRTLASNVFGSENVALGAWCGQYNEGTGNCYGGYSAFKLSTKGQENTGFGYKCGVGNTTGYRNTYVGWWTFGQQTTGEENSGLGWSAGKNLKLGSRNIFLGSRTGQALLTGSDNTFVGALAGFANGDGVVSFNGMVGVGGQAIPFGTNAIAVGYNARVGTVSVGSPGSIAIGQSTNAVGSTPAIAIGDSSSANGARVVAVGETAAAVGDQTTAIGSLASASGLGNTSLGCQAGRGSTGSNNTFLGRAAGGGLTNTYSNCTLLGYSSTITGDNQIQLGSTGTNVYGYSSYNIRCDIRDKIDYKEIPEELAFEFIKNLNYYQGRHNFRDSYREVDEAGNVTYLENDGSKAGSRTHFYRMAQEVDALCKRLGIDFAGVQHHAVNGGEDVWTLGDAEFSPIAEAALKGSLKRLDAIEARLTKIETQLAKLG